MTSPVKTRSYRSPRRQEQAAATRRSVLRAAHDLFTRDGYAATTVTAIAAAAGVSLDTVYASVGRKPELVLAVIDQVLASSDEPVGLEEREYVKDIRRAGTAHAKIEIYAAAVGRLVPQIAPLQDALRRAAEGDAACAAVWAGMLERRAANVLLLAQDLRTTGELRADLTDEEVADIVGSTNAVEYYLLLARRGWTPERYSRLLADLWSRMLLGPVSPGSGPTRVHDAVATRADPGGWRSPVRGTGHGAGTDTTYLQGASMARVAVTGGSGKLGRAVVTDLAAHGYDVLNLDRAAPPEGQPGDFVTDRPHRLRPGPRRPDRRGRAAPGGGRRRAPRRHPGAGARPERRDVHQQRAEQLPRLRGGARRRHPHRGLGVQRDGARAAVRHPAALRPGRRGLPRQARDDVLAGQGRRGGDGLALLPVGPAARRWSGCASRT